MAYQAAWADSPDKLNKTELIKLEKVSHFMMRVRFPSVQLSSEQARDHRKKACIGRVWICGYL
ncbi:MAG TPA: hypothetical protein VE710_13355 [Candidatus Bathyarchaeia archaeon]|nr:hypothetical protein [Candidatus Bathyarchaeia archaeon]